MRKLRTALATAVTTASFTALLAGSALAGSALAADAAARPAADDPLGCPSGYVCLIASDGTIANKYYRYGTYNLAGKYGDWIVDNNQTGGAHVDLCYNYGGSNCFEGPPAGSWDWYNLTPINSIKLRA